MRKFLYLAAAAMTVIMTSCNKNEDRMTSRTTEVNEMSIRAVVSNVAKTKGYVTGTDFQDLVGTQLHLTEGQTPTDRTMIMSAYMNPIYTTSGNIGAPENYFVKRVFSNEESDGVWRTTPKVYWPLSSELDFLAYSVENDFNPTDVEWNQSNAASTVKINVLENYSQDDILYGGQTKVKSETSASSVNMKFGHAQAWLSFNIKANENNLVAVKDIIIENCYNTGELILSRLDAADANGVFAKAEWNFRHETKKDVVFDDILNTYGSIGEAPGYALTNAVSKDAASTKYLDMLVPEQAKTSFVIEYYLAGQPTLLKYKFELADNWEMGKHYTYDVNFNINEITVAPTVVEYTDGMDATPIPGELK